MTIIERTAVVKKAASDAGFTFAGITSADPFNTAADRLDEWLARRMHGTMSYMERNTDKRRDPKLIYPDTKSILALALNYYHPHQTPQLKISRYAWGDDYHEIIGTMLDELLRRIKSIIPEADGKYYVDTGPVLEKAVAERAGIGWIGKHTNLITREKGSWVFLAEIFLNIELTPDSPAEDMCGTCNACIDACPTDAITAPYVLDAAKCISYMTIELKPQNEIPDELVPKLDGWLYGCDICQDVCPWNRFSTETQRKEFSPREAVTNLTAEMIEQMQQEEFSETFRRSPIKRTKLAGLKRNLKALLNK
jgi:epoxyqueuosine reductase